MTELVSDATVGVESPEGGEARPARTLAVKCGHCGSRAKHGERIGCCSGCGTLFTSLSAFERHRRKLRCVAPLEAGLEPKVVKGDPSVMGWGWPAGNRPQFPDEESEE